MSVALGCDIARLAGHLKVTSAYEKTLTEVSTTATKHNAPYNSLAWRRTEFSCLLTMLSEIAMSFLPNQSSIRLKEQYKLDSKNSMGEW